MGWLTIERGGWSAAAGAFLSFLAVTLLVPFGSLMWVVAFCVLLPVGAAVVYWVGFVGSVGPRTDQPGRLTLWFLTAFVVAIVGYMATFELTSDGSIPELLGQVLSLMLSGWVANWLVHRNGVERLRNRVAG
ncbi:hypothetical protein [Halococcus sp. AFM35]|uniref:hypothetical protein n=1 Tax=Halococcus sp. AFM35 TaxID=3421653 RepID=UPI003EC098F3